MKIKSINILNSYSYHEMLKRLIYVSRQPVCWLRWLESL